MNKDVWGMIGFIFAVLLFVAVHSGADPAANPPCAPAVEVVQVEQKGVSLLQYRGGMANYLSVLNSQSSLFSAELTLAQARNNEYQSLVQLYKALGGGWMQAAQPSTPSVP